MREGFEFWDRFCKLQRSSFWLNDKALSVMQINDSLGNWNSHEEVGDLVGEIQSEINKLKAQNKALEERLKLRLVD